jgi:hypothetical protein
MSHSSIYLLRPTVWMSRADLDRLRAADARASGESRRRGAPRAPGGRRRRRASWRAASGPATAGADTNRGTEEIGAA